MIWKINETTIPHNRTFFSTPTWAAGSYGYEPSASKLVNDAKKLIKKDKYERAIKKLEKANKGEFDNAKSCY